MRFEISFVEIGADDNHVHFLIQSVPMLSVKNIAKTVKSITEKELFRLHPEIKIKLWGGQFWSSGYYVNTVGQYANEQVIQRYITGQGNEKNKNKQFKRVQLILLNDTIPRSSASGSFIKSIQY